MPRNKLAWDGLDELLAALRKLPPTIAEEGHEIIENRVELARAEIVQRYPRRTGNLRKGVVVRQMHASGLLVGLRLLNVAPHAHIFELGTEARHTKLGANRGAMPAGKIFVPTVIRHRRLMEAELVAMLQRAGLVVLNAAA